MAESKHPNRRAINWLLYEISDRFLEKYSPHFRGALYDLGCGEKSHESFFLRHADRYIGVDWAGTLHSLKADVIADLNKPLPIENNAADSVVSLSVLEHLCEPQTMLNEAWRILKPGGAIVLQVPWQWWIHEAPYDYYRYTPYGLRYMLEKAGFQEIVIEPQCGFFTTWIVKFNYFSSRYVLGPNPVRWIIRAVLSIFWYTGQKLAPYLDKLDRQWELESQGYYVLAKKSLS